MSVARRLGVIAGGCVLALCAWAGLGESMRAAPLAPDPITCLPTCAMDGRSLVVAGDDNTTLGAQEITLGLNFTAAAGPDGNFQLFDGDRVGGGVQAAVSQDNQTGEVTIGGLAPGTYILRLKWSGKSLVGQTAPNPETIYYTFVAELNGVVDPQTQNDTPLALVKR